MEFLWDFIKTLLGFFLGVFLHLAYTGLFILIALWLGTLVSSLVWWVVASIVLFIVMVIIEGEFIWRFVLRRNG